MLKKIIIIISELLLTISLFTLIVFLSFSSTIGNKNYMLKALAKNNYYESTYNTIIDSIESNLIQLDLDKETIESLLSQDQVKEDINRLINSIYDNKIINIDTTEIVNKLDQIINNKYQENNRIPSQEEQKTINELEQGVKEIYEDTIAISLKYIPKIQESYHKINLFKNKIILFLSIMVAFLIFFIPTLSKRLTTIFTPILTSGFLLITIKLLLQNKFKNILILGNNFSKILRVIINDSLKTILIVGIILSIISIIGIIIRVKQRHIK